MGYILLSAAVLCIIGQFALTKYYQKSVRQTLVTAMFFILLQNIVSFLIFFIYNGFRWETFTGYSFVIAAVSATVMIVYNILSLKLMSLGSVSVYSLFMMLGGMLLPFIEGLIVYPETNQLTICKGIGIVVLPLILIIQVWGKNKKENNRATKVFYLLCVCIFFINGFTSILISLQSNPIGNFPAMTANEFTMLKNLILIVVSGGTIGFLMMGKNLEAQKTSLQEAARVRPVLFAIMMSIVTSIGGFLLLVANETVPNVVQYPIVSGGTIVLSAVVSSFVFKEKQTMLDKICFASASLATLLFLF